MYPGLRYADKKLNFACKKFFLNHVCLSIKFDMRLKKKQKRFGAILELPGKVFVVEMETV